MAIFYGVLIGLMYPVIAVLIFAATVSGRTGYALRVAVAVLLASAGPVVWAIVFASLGIAAGIASFGGWLLGVAIAVPLTVYLVLSRIRKPRFPRSRTTRTSPR